MQCDVDLRFGGAGAEVWRADEVGLPEKGAVLRGFGLEHVERSARDLTAIKRIGESRFIDQATACTVDDANALLGLSKILAAENVARLVCQRRVQRDEVCTR